MFFVTSIESRIWNICITIFLTFKEAQAWSLMLIKLEFQSNNNRGKKDISSHFVMSAACLFLLLPQMSPPQTKLDLRELLALLMFGSPCVSGVRHISLASASELFNLNYSSAKVAAVSQV